MKNKIVGIMIFMLIATTMVSATDINVKKDIQTTISGDFLSWNNNIVEYQPILFDWGVDQKQTLSSGWGEALYPPYLYAQSFTPTKDKLTAVSLCIFKFGDSTEPVQIAVSIRDNLTHLDLAIKTIDTSVIAITSKGTWVLFDFEDISINSGSAYYIICSGSAGSYMNAYCWFAGNSDLYIKGEPWIKENDADWITYKQSEPSHPDADFCFKTYFLKPFDVSILKNNIMTIPISYNIPLHPRGEQLFQRFPNAFPLLRQLMES